MTETQWNEKEKAFIKLGKFIRKSAENKNLKTHEDEMKLFFNTHDRIKIEDGLKNLEYCNLDKEEIKKIYEMFKEQDLLDYTLKMMTRNEKYTTALFVGLLTYDK